MRFIAAFTALAFYLGLAAPYVVHAQEEPDESAEEATAKEDEETVEATGATREAARAVDPDEEPTDESDKPAPSTNQTQSLPSGPGKSAVTPQAISLPKGEGSIEGMGESFTPNLSAGTGTFSVPIALPAGRAGVQPSLALSYSTAGGNGPVGIGWSLAAPFISRQTDRGLPKYIEAGGLWHPEEDRFMYNGGQELVPVDSDEATVVDSAPVPGEFSGWQQYRARVEGAFMRFFRSPDHSRWVVQDKGGTRFEFGRISDGPSEVISASRDALLSENANGAGRIFQWSLTRMSDVHGSSVYYVYAADQGQRYLDSIYYVSPIGCAGAALAQRTCGASLAQYARRVKLVYEARSDVFDSYITTWKVSTARRLKRIEVTGYDADAGGRTLVRRYHLRYDGNSFLSLLNQVQVEGRPDSPNIALEVDVGNRGVSEGSLGNNIVGRTLPPMTFTYSAPTGTTTAISGFGGVNGTVHTSPRSPAHSVDEARTDLFDVNSDGLPDVIVTDPARYRTSDGSPAVGVFFNGFTGPDATPSTAGSFSSAVPVQMPEGDSGVMHLGNLNIVPMDTDGDGRSDLLHMPRVASYGYYTPATTTPSPSQGEGDQGGEVSPKDQNWQFAKVEVSTATGFTDPRIDFGRDGEFIQVVDVNNDHLIDVVRTTGTVMQTWLNLGWVPLEDRSGDGRFGQAHHNGNDWVLSPEPLESCVLQGAQPVDFANPEVRLGDMNGDGLQDIIQMRRGRVQYWPGRGAGLWGEGPAECDRGEGANRYVEMATPPQELSPELDSVFVSDVNQDGASDIVQVRTQAIDVYFNRAGKSFTARTIINNSPFAPSYAPRVRFADVDGSGTTDILFATANNYRWIDPMGGERPRLLIGVENGLGGLTTLEYDTSVNDYLTDLADAASCEDTSCERFTWNATRGECDQKVEQAGGGCVYRSGGSPVVSTVVRAVTTSDQMSRLGASGVGDFIKRTEYAYHEGYYEGIEQEFRGFGAADAIEVGDDTHPTSITRTHFYQGRRPNEIASDRIVDNPMEALKGRTYRTEVRDEAGKYLSSEHASFSLRHLLTGLNDVAVSYAFVNRTDTVLYDTENFIPSPGATLPSAVTTIAYESAGNGLSVFNDDGEETRSLPLRSSGDYSHVQSTVGLVDNAGNMTAQTANGRVHKAEGETGSDESITSHSVPDLWGPDSDWLWRTMSTWITGSASGALQLGRTDNSYNAVGDLIAATQAVSIPGSVPSYQFVGDSLGAQSLTQSAENVVASTSYDSWGNALASCGGADLVNGTTGCLRYGSVTYDDDHALFPVTEQIAATRIFSAFAFLTTSATWDRGLGVLLSAVDPNGLETHVTYDGLGRLTSMTPPNVAGCDNANVPLTRIRYELGSPLSTIHATTEQSCSGVGEDSLISRSFVDGLGRARVSLLQAENNQWQRSGITTFTARGATLQAYQPSLLAGSGSGAEALTFPGAPFTTTFYDAFSRPWYTLAEDGSPTKVIYYGLRTDVWDSNDQNPASPHYNTPTSERKDGHGRVIDQVLRNRQPGSSEIEYYRLWTDYRADGQVTTLTRTETSTDAPRYAPATIVDAHSSSRTFHYDSVGRRLGSTDPDADNPSDTNEATKSWRYRYNRVGDLVAVRDPRGCGQNFYYDHAGRLTAEDYVECTEAQTNAEAPSETLPAYAIGATESSGSPSVDVRYYFDAYPFWFAVGGAPDDFPGGTPLAGRATAVLDRGQRSVMAYDDRGNVIWSGRQMAVIPNAAQLTATSLTGDGPTVNPTHDVVGTRPEVTYDEHWYTRIAEFDHASRPQAMFLPLDPAQPSSSPRIGGTLTYNQRNLPLSVSILFDTAGVRSSMPIVAELLYTRDGLVENTTYGDDAGGREPTVTHVNYDSRRRPVDTLTTRESTTTSETLGLNAVTVVDAQALAWDAVSNLVAVGDNRNPEEWPDGFEPRSYSVMHDALYRVADVAMSYDNGTQEPAPPEPDICVAPEPIWPVPSVSYPAPTPPPTIPNNYVSTLPQYQASASPGPVLLSFPTGTFSRTTPASRMDLDESDAMVVELVGPDTLRTEHRTGDPEDAVGPLYMFEGPRENISYRTTDLNLWSLSGVTVTANTQAGPAINVGSPMADTIYFSTASTTGWFAYQTASGDTVAGATVWSTSVYHYSGVGRIRFGSVYSPEFSSTAGWKRFEFNSPPTQYPAITRPIDNATLPEDVVLWGIQVEAAPFPSSYIHRPGTDVTWRQADSLSFASAPSTLTSGKWEFEVYPEYGTADGGTTSLTLSNKTYGLYSFANAQNAIALHFDGSGNTYVRVINPGLAGGAQNVAHTWDRHERIKLAIDLAADTISIDGASPVALSGLSPFPTGTVRIGALHDSTTGKWVAGSEAFARISEPRRSMATCTSNSDCSTGYVCGTDRGDHYGLASTADVCWPSTCGGSGFNNNCGSVASTCGLCCITDSDCSSGKECGINAGPRKGLPVGTNLCWADGCNDTRNLSLCGSTSAACGLCPVLPSGTAPLLSYGSGTFTRGSFATRLDYDYNGAGEREIIVAPVGTETLRTERHLTDPPGAPTLYLFEGQRANYIRRATELDIATVWNKTSLRTSPEADGIAENSVASPDPSRSVTAETVYISTGPGTAGLVNYTWFKNFAPYNSGTWLNVPVTVSTFHKSGRMLIGMVSTTTRDSDTYPPPSASSSMQWTRFDYTAPTTIGSAYTTYAHLVTPTPPAISDVVAWGAQAEVGAFPSSFIHSSAALFTARNADKLEFPAASVPADLRNGSFRFDVYPEYGSSDGYRATIKPEGLANQTFGLISFDNATSSTPADGIALYFDAQGMSHVRVVQGGVAQDIRKDWKRDQRIAIRVDLNGTAPRIEIDGVWYALNASSFANNASVNLLIGGAYNVSHALDPNMSAFARISEPGPFAIGCMVDSDCPSGHLCGDNNGARFGASDADVCWPAYCESDASLHCGSETASCGACCLADGDCASSEYCAIGGGAQKGLGQGSNVCLADACSAQVLTAVQCGVTSAMCGLCSNTFDAALSYSAGTFTRTSSATSLDFDPVTRGLRLQKYASNELRTERRSTDLANAPPLYLFEGERINWSTYSAQTYNTWGFSNMMTPGSPNSATAPDGRGTAMTFDTTPPAGGSLATASIIMTGAIPVASTSDPVTLYNYSIFYTGNEGWLYYAGNGAPGYTAAPNTSDWSRVVGRGSAAGSNPSGGYNWMYLYFGRRGGYPVSTLQAWGRQVERAAFPSSFIYTDATAGGPTNTRAADILSYTTTPTEIRDGVWEVDIYPLHAPAQDAYHATNLPLGLRNKDFGLFAFAGDTSDLDGNFISLRYSSTGATSLHIEQSAGVDAEIPFFWQRHQPITLTVDTVADTVNLSGIVEQPFEWGIPEGPMMVGSLYNSSGGLLTDSSAFARMSEPRVAALVCNDNSDCAQGSFCGNSVASEWPENTTDSYSEWRDEMASVQADDPMRTEPAPNVSTAAETRVMSLVYEYDWLANMTSWDDDAQKFYERSIGVISNGFDVGKRPSALYLASDLPTQAAIQYASGERGGYVELDYGVSGNVVAMTVRAQCADPVPTGWSSAPPTCYDNRSLSLDARKTHLHSNCVCAKEQHYQYRWDELNRLSEARRYDRDGSGTWDLAARQRYRYDGANQRVVKQTLDVTYTTGTTANGLTVDPTTERIALYVYGGDYERRGMVRDDSGSDLIYTENPDGSTETQFLVGGARVVQTSPGAGQGEGGGLLHPDDRVTVGITDLIGSTSAVIDLVSGALVETSTYYPNGARETYRAPDTENVAAEPMGFTGKEADEEVGLTYFGERYLIPRIGRWASPDPLSVHAAGGGEALNAYHYVSGNLLQARDPLGLEEDPTGTADVESAVPPVEGTPGATFNNEPTHQYWGATPDGAPLNADFCGVSCSSTTYANNVHEAGGLVNHWDAASAEYSATASVPGASATTLGTDLGGLSLQLDPTLQPSGLSQAGLGISADVGPHMNFGGLDVERTAFRATGAFIESAATSLVAGVVVSAALASGTFVGGALAVGVIGYGAYSLGTGLAEVVGGGTIDGTRLSLEDRIVSGAGLLGGLAGTGGGVAGWRFGKEWSFPSLTSSHGQVPRAAPWGNRTTDTYGEFPHYHRAEPHPNPRKARQGASAEDQSLRRHRPIEPRRSDRSWRDRF